MVLHLPGAENRILEARASLLAVFLSSYKSDLQEARRHAATALRSARACGARSVLLPALASAAFVAANTGRFEEARELLAQGLEQDISEHARIAMLDTALQSAIARNQIKEAEAIASEIDRSTSAFPAGASLYSAINIPTRVRLLARLDQNQSALELAESSLESMKRVVDRHIFEVTRLLTAEMAGFAGREQQAVDLLSSCILDRLHQQPEILAESHRVTGQLLSPHPKAAAEHLARAVRIFAGIGHEIGRADAERCLKALAPRGPATGAELTTSERNPKATPGPSWRGHTRFGLGVSAFGPSQAHGE